MNVVYIATDSYISQLGISLLSLLDHEDDLSSLSVYILSPDLSKESKAILREMSQIYSASLYFLDISGYERFLPKDISTSGFHPIVMARLLLDFYLPANVHSVLYMDCDVAVNGSVKALESLPLEKYAMAAVPELAMPPAQKKAIGLNAQETYFNCGVLVINLDYWRSHNMRNHFLSYLAEKNGRLLYNDQDILNHCCRGHILRLSHRYNLPPVLKYFPRWFIKTYQPLYYGRDKKEYRRILKNPSVIHYLGDERPWIRGNHNPYRHVWNKYKALSPWADEPQEKGREWYMFCYHMLNCITFICPWFRKYFTKLIGIRYYQFVSKK